MINKFELMILKYLCYTNPQDEREMRLVTEISAKPICYVLIGSLIGGIASLIYDGFNNQHSIGTYILWIIAFSISVYLDVQFKKQNLRKILVYSKQEEDKLKRKMIVTSFFGSLSYTSLFILFQIYLPLMITGKSLVTFRDMYGIYIILFAVIWLISYGKKVELIKREDHI